MKRSAAFPPEVQKSLHASRVMNPSYHEAVAEFDYLWESGRSQNSAARMDKMLEIIETVEPDRNQQTMAGMRISRAS